MSLQPCSTPYPHWLFEDPASGDALRLVPERGGLLTGWRCGGQEVLYLDVERFLDPALSIRGGAPVLFPICGNLPDDRLPLADGRSATLRQHGFARTLPWALEALADGDGVALVLQDTPATLADFPFPFVLRLEYRLAPQALQITTTVENRGSQPLPFSFGLHPYLAVSGLEGLTVEGLPTHCLDHRQMAEADTAEQLAQLSTGIDLLVRPVGSVSLCDPAAGRRITMELESPWNLAVLWTDPPRPMLCVEPWTGPRGSLISGDGRLEVEPGQSRSLRCRYTVAALGG